MANKIYVSPGTVVTPTITLTNLDHTTGRTSSQTDRGNASVPSRYRVRASFTMGADHATVLGELIELYLVPSDGTTVDGTVGTSDAAITTEKRRNLTPIGAVQVDVAATAATVFTRTFTVYIYDRYFSVAVWNGTSDRIASGSITLTPVSDEIQ